MDIKRTEHNYMMLSRYQSDMEYYFNFGGMSDRVLYFKDFHTHLNEMIKLWKILPEKPVWLRARQLIEYRTRWKKLRTRGLK